MTVKEAWEYITEFSTTTDSNGTLLLCIDDLPKYLKACDIVEEALKEKLK